MPQLFRIAGYLVYFWSNEQVPLEPVHVHVVQGKPIPDATKIWITQGGGCILCHNKSQIPERLLRNIMAVIQARHEEITTKWVNHFGEISYIC